MSTPTWKQAYITSGALYLERIDSANVWTLDQDKAARFPLNAPEHRPDFVDHIAAAVMGEVTPCAPWPQIDNEAATLARIKARPEYSHPDTLNKE